MKKRYFHIVFSIFFVFMTLQITLADNNFGWEGHDIYFLNSFDARIAGKKLKINIREDKVKFNGEFVINNTSDNIVEVVVGLPSDNINNLTITDKGNNLRFYSRSNAYVEKNYAYSDLPNVERWSTVNLWLKQNESRLITINYDYDITNDNKGIYKVEYNNNVMPYDLGALETTIVFDGVKPYNIVNTYGVEMSDSFYNKGSQIIFECDSNNQEVRIDYELTDDLAVNRLDFSTSNKIKNIAKLYRMKDYEAIITNCDEYLANPADPAIDNNQIKYMKSEALRRVARFDEYKEVIKDMDISKLYPDRLKYKLLFDVDDIYNGEIEDIELYDSMQTLQDDALGNNEFIAKWMIHNGKEYLEVSKDTVSQLDETVDKGFFGRILYAMKTNKIIKAFKEFKYFNLLSGIIIFALGYFIGKRSKRRRRNVPYYTFKR